MVVARDDERLKIQKRPPKILAVIPEAATRIGASRRPSAGSAGYPGPINHQRLWVPALAARGWDDSLPRT